MATTEPYFSLVKIGASSWSAVLVRNGEAVVPASLPKTTQKSGIGAIPAAAGWSQQFSRIAIALVALTVFAASLTAEIEYLRQTGHLFR